MNIKLPCPTFKLCLHPKARKQELFILEGTLHYIGHVLQKAMSNKDQNKRWWMGYRAELQRIHILQEGDGKKGYHN